jgi:hypothetical protein
VQPRSWLDSAFDPLLPDDPREVGSKSGLADARVCSKHLTVNQHNVTPRPSLFSPPRSWST